ncbi:MAG: hypothetical protein QM484_12125 [Woeseiaceae bacterium]
MKKIILPLLTLTLISCASVDEPGIQFIDKSPRGITATNVTKELYSKAYQMSESHCAKYSKVPKLTKKVQQSANYTEFKQNLIFNCIRPSRGY